MNEVKTIKNIGKNPTQSLELSSYSGWQISKNAPTWPGCQVTSSKALDSIGEGTELCEFSRENNKIEPSSRTTL